MPLPVTFATLAQGNEPLALIDGQFGALSRYTIIGCTATGQNDVVLTPFTTAPSFTSYFDICPVFSWSQSQTTTGPVTISVAGLAALKAYGSNGGVALGAGDLVAGGLYTAAFLDGLNSFAGGFVVNAQTPVTSQGSWLPTFFGSSVAGTPAYVSQAGSYEQIGRQVTARFTVITTALTGITGLLRIGGLPFANNSSEPGFCAIAYFSGWNGGAGFTFLGTILDPSVSYMRIVKSGSGSAYSETLISEWSAASVVAGVISYHV